MKAKILIFLVVLCVSGCDINIYHTDKKDQNVVPNNQINNQQSTNNQNRNNTHQDNQKQINIQEAKNIVLNDVGFKENQVVFIKEKEDFENNGIEFEFEFINNNIKYEYAINQVGNIIKKEQENILID